MDLIIRTLLNWKILLNNDYINYRYHKIRKTHIFFIWHDFLSRCESKVLRLQSYQLSSVMDAWVEDWQSGFVTTLYRKIMVGLEKTGAPEKPL